MSKILTNDLKEKIAFFKKEVEEIRLDFKNTKEGRKDRVFSACIYCGSQEKLTDEHAFPFALSGKHILRNASCIECAKVTSLFELKILRGPLADYRYFKKFKSRSKHKTLKSDKVFRVKNHQNEESSRALKLDTVGSFIFFPEFDPASYTEKGKNIKIKDIHYIRIETHKQKPNDIAEMLFTQDFPLEDYLRFLAKIAYCFACLDQKIEEFDIFIMPLILGIDDSGSWKLVGTPTEHLFKSNDYGTAMFLNPKGILSCHIKLFKESPLVYEVIIGKQIKRKVLEEFFNRIKSRFSLLKYVWKKLKESKIL